MEHLSIEEKKRVGEALQNVYENLADKIKNVEILSNSLEKKMTTFQPRLINFLKGKCQEEYQWIEKYGKLTEVDGQIKIDVPVDQRPFAEENFRKWEKCSEKNDLGVKKFFNAVETENIGNQKSNEVCMNSCIKDISSKSNQDIEKCFTGCFTNFFTKTEFSLNQIVDKVSQFDKQLI